MGGKSSKKQAVTNKNVLFNLYKVSIPIVLLATLRNILTHDRHWMKFILLHIPMLFCIYTLDKSGRPKYDENGKLLNEGIDLLQLGGLTEYIFDFIYLSLFGDLGKILLNTNKFWYILLCCPIYAGYKLYSIKHFIPGINSKTTQLSSEQEDIKSKRQIKREKRGDKQQYKYR